MNRHITLAGLAFAAVTSATSIFGLVGPAAAADPVCEFGFTTVQKTSWLLICRKTVPLMQKGVALTEAGNTNCKTNSYWNFGPKVEAKHLFGNRRVRVTVTCGHVEG